MDFTLLPILLLAAPSAIPPIHIHAALNGRPRYVDSLLFCLGMQTPLTPQTLNDGEYPACAAMTTGHVFRVENQATVMYLRNLQRTGHLVTLEVKPNPQQPKHGGLMYAPVTSLVTPLVFNNVNAIDKYFLSTVFILLLSRLLTIASLRARTTPSWHGASEPDVQGDLLILLSEDGWIRLKGAVDDLKAVTSGSWLSRRPPQPWLFDLMDWTARLLPYIAMITLSSTTNYGKSLIIVSLLLAHASIALSNSRTKELNMNNRIIKISEQPGSVKQYSRRLDMAEHLIKETGRSDFAVRLGLINPDQAVKTETTKGRGTSGGGGGGIDDMVVTM
ncbi:hypothetical protein UCRPC4_g03162 [Phaeomoniella chlamydospora]|uniref:Uncharacterized protein n=1 Tax=Phaeomoniella chlamydospora TaxID=158046 RepID=A0A0G2EII2_PHACM|nr:hypothetical protein UCRPC4_g03162 [Phaeomoniella chlamydospora]